MMPKAPNWSQVSFEQHVDLLAGFAFKSSRFTDDPLDIPLVKGADVQQGYVDWDGCKRWPETPSHKLDKYWLQEGDVVLAMDRPWVPSGLKWAWVRQGAPKSLLVQRVARLRGRNGLLTDYLRYVIGSAKFTDYIRPIVTGVNVPHISGSQILGFTFALPPLHTQRKIATILSAYDDLIENNLRRIKILEEMARNLYREWFVKFRFPGYEQARFVDSPLGRIPEAWEVVPLSDIVSLCRKGVEPQKHPSESFEYFSFPAYDSGRLPVIDEGRTIKSRKYEVPPSCVMVPKLNPHIPRVWLPRPSSDLRSIASTEYLILEPKKYSTAFYYVLFSGPDMVGKLTGRADGTSTSHKRLKPGDFMEQPIVAPPDCLADAFDSLAVPAMDLVTSLIHKSATLRRTRDLLLPRLISGEVDVSELDIAVPEEAGV